MACLRALGAELVEFSPLADQPSWPGGRCICPAAIELHAETLNCARTWQPACAPRRRPADLGRVRRHDGAGRRHRNRGRPQLGMAGLLPGVARYARPAGWPGRQAWGALCRHTFHYSRLELPPEPQAHTVSQRGGRRGEAIYRVAVCRPVIFIPTYFPSAPSSGGLVLACGRPPMLSGFAGLVAGAVPAGRRGAGRLVGRAAPLASAGGLWLAGAAAGSAAQPGGRGCGAARWLGAAGGPGAAGAGGALAALPDSPSGWALAAGLHALALYAALGLRSLAEHT